MAMGRRKKERQGEFWIAADQVVGGPGHPFYRRLNEVFESCGFDRFVEGLCERFYHEELGRPGIAPGVYFRMLRIGFFEGIDSERGIDWRCSDSLTLREFLGYTLAQRTPDHSTLCTIRQRIDRETHREVFAWVLAVVAEQGLLKARTLGIDATTLEANAAMRSIVRKDTGESYEQYLTALAQANGIQTPTREDLTKIDRTRKNKASNQDWESPSDPDAKITKRKDGRTHAGGTEHASDLETGAIVGVTLQPADRGDTTSLDETVAEAVESLLDVREHGVEVDLPQEIVADKGCHRDATCADLKSMGFRSYLSEPDRGERNWAGKQSEPDAVYGNRRRIRGKRGKGLLRKRGELVERPFAHCHETGGMRRTHLRGHENLLKRLLIHVAGFNLALVLRVVFGLSKPRTLQDGLGGLLGAVLGEWRAWIRPVQAVHAALTALLPIIGPNRSAQPRLAAA
jgi:transposase